MKTNPSKHSTATFLLLILAGWLFCLPVAVSFAHTVSFNVAMNFAVGAGPLSVAVGDFNGDGIQDLAVANQSSANVSILLGTGTGSFGAATNFAAGRLPVSVAVADFDGDGIQDLAVATNVSDNVSILLGTGTGSFGAATSFVVGSTPSSVALGDFNGDGIQDLAVANEFRAPLITAF
jgi:hypothetical protein